MPKGSLPGGDLAPIDNCYLRIPGFGIVTFYAVPDISESKSAQYNDENIPGRSFPLKTYSHSGDRTISMTIHLYVRKKTDVSQNIATLRAIQSCLYPQDAGVGGTAPFIPPPICQIRCGYQLADGELCVILKSCNTRYPTDVPWDEETYFPYKLDIETSWDIVYRTANLPGQSRILQTGG